MGLDLHGADWFGRRCLLARFIAVAVEFRRRPGIGHSVTPFGS